MVRSILRLILFGFIAYGFYIIWSCNFNDKEQPPQRRPYDYNKVFRVHETNW